MDYKAAGQLLAGSATALILMSGASFSGMKIGEKIHRDRIASRKEQVTAEEFAQSRNNGRMVGGLVGMVLGGLIVGTVASSYFDSKISDEEDFVYNDGAPNGQYPMR